MRSALPAIGSSPDVAILDGIDLGVATTDQNGVIQFLNRTGRELLASLGTSSTEIQALLGLSASPGSLLGDEIRCRLISQVVVEGVDLALEVEISRSIDDGQRVVGYFFVFRDVIADEQAELERHRLERLAAMGTMVAGFAHEVRNPVASLRSLAESLSEELADAHIKLSHADRMLEVLVRVERLVDTWLKFGKPPRANRGFFHPWTILSGATSALAARTTTMREQLKVEMAPDLPDAFVDESQLVQVLVVLLNNAIDATGSPGRVSLRAVDHRAADPDGRIRRSQPPPGPPSIRFEVTDDGPGVPPELRSRIFDPFFTTKASGIGLGLSIAQQLVAENGGRLEVGTSATGSTTFSVIVSTAPQVELGLQRLR